MTGPALDQLSRERLAQGRRILADLAAERDRLAEAAQAESADGPASRAYAAWDVAVRFAGRPAEQLRCLLFAAAGQVAEGGAQHFTVAAECLGELPALQLDLVAGDVRALAIAAEPGPGRDGYLPFVLVVALVEKLLGDGARGAGALAEAVADQVLGWNALDYYSPESRHYRQRVSRIRDKALELAGYPPALPAAEGPVSRGDGYGQAVISWLGPVRRWPAGVPELLAHCVAAKPARPPARWQSACAQLLAGVADACGLLRGLLQLVVTAPPASCLTDHGRRSVLLGHNEQLVRGLVLAAGILDPPWLPDVLREVAVRCLRLCHGHAVRDTPVPGEKIPYACFRSLAQSGSGGSVAALAAIGRCTSDRSVLRQLGKALGTGHAEGS